MVDLPAEQKVQKFQDQCRINYKEFMKLNFYLRSLADQVKKEIQEKKMETSKMSKEKCMKEITQFKGVKDLHYFLMNVLNLILFKGYYYCFCEKFEKNKEKCTLYWIPIIFENFRKKLDYNMENPIFLKAYHAKLVPYLVEISDMNKSAIKCFWNNEHNYSGWDWNTGKK